MATPEFVLALREKIGHDELWLPGVTAVVLRDAEVLLVRRADTGAWTPVTGIVDPGEEPAVAAEREVLEETAHFFAAESLVGVYLSRFQRGTDDITYLRFTFCGTLGALQAGRSLDIGIVRTVWMSADEIRNSADRHRSPLLIQCMEDYLLGKRFALDAITTDASVYQPSPIR